MDKIQIVRALCEATNGSKKTGAYRSYYKAFTGLETKDFKTPLECLYSFLQGAICKAKDTEELNSMWIYICKECNINQVTGVPNEQV